MARTVTEWSGKNDDSMPPPRVLLRLFDRHNGVCHVCKRKIAAGEPWSPDHVIALVNGGKNVESNLAPVHREVCHPDKSRKDVKTKAKIARTRKKHVGIIAPKQEIKSAPFARSEKAARKAERAPKTQPPRRSLYQEMTHD